MLNGCPKHVSTDTLVSQVNKSQWLGFWALFDGLSSWAKENKPNKQKSKKRNFKIESKVGSQVEMSLPSFTPCLCGHEKIREGKNIG